ncbi:MAG: flavin-containing monooxygenase [Lautropia sp.]
MAEGRGPRAAAADAGVDLVIVGAGFAGMAMLHAARGQGLRARVFEAGAEVGGTWYWNRYPGARCDIESLEYSYQFSESLQQQWHWTERFAAQPEILRYAIHVADRFGLRRDIAFSTRVLSARFDETDGAWLVGTDDGQATRARFLVMATGCLSSTHLPAIAGRETFAGESLHTGAWPHGPVDFTGRRVAVIGTGSSAVQSIPLIAEQASALIVFQRTATWSIPARNRPVDPAYEAQVKADYAGFRRRNDLMQAGFGANQPRNDRSVLDASPAERDAVFAAFWARGGLGFGATFNDLMLGEEANGYATAFLRARIREIVRDPAVAELLCPRQPVGCKRICIDSGYYETFNRDNVSLVDVSATPIERITPRGPVVAGREYPVDAIVYATGFDAMTGALLKIDIRGRDGVSLRSRWEAGPTTYLGLSIAGFPNLFTISGPGSPSVLTNMLVSIEQHVNWIADCLAWMRVHGRTRIEADPDAERAWGAHVNAVADRTLYPRCNSWYLGANVDGKPRVFMPLIGFPAYVEKCNAVARGGYTGFATR